MSAASSTGTSPSTASAWSDSGRLLIIVVQLGIILLFARAFHIENAAFYAKILPLAIGGAVVNHLLPLRYRAAFFAALGVTGIGLVFGVVSGAWLVALGTLLIGLCHLPVAFRWRVAAIVVVSAGLMMQRGGLIVAPWPSVIWPIFGSIFMFRLAIYLYDLKHRGPASPGLTFSYFFMLPNIVFPLFPVVDFHTFRRTYYDKNPIDVYDEGVRWILRGLTHLVLYRMVYQYVALSPTAVESTADLVQYLVGNFGLYLRVSGQFHVAIGLLHLFGFRLPETHRFFYLASSFSDLWRRINIYWKDFMQKMVYLPVMFGLKRRGETTALVGATVAVVAVTWFLHSYQWFWLLGVWLFSATDAVFWGILGIFLIANTLREQRRGRARQITARALTIGAGVRHALQTAGMFGLMCILWGFWTSPSFEGFNVLIRAATFRPIDLAVIAAVLGTVAVIAFVVRHWSLDRPWELGSRPWSHHPILTCVLPLAIVWGLGEPQVARGLPVLAQSMLRDTRVAELNKYDAERLQRGYYEKIVGVNSLNGQLWEVYARAEPAEGEALQQLGAMDSRNDGLQKELRPMVGTVFKGGTFRTNRWGMRDRDYPLLAPPGTVRMAVLGQSYVMGSGVNDGEPFESVVEDRLNADWTPVTGQRYELLNFALPRYSLIQNAIILENGRVSGFSPNVVLVVGHGSDRTTLTEYVWEELRANRQFAEPEMQSLIAEAEVTGRLSSLETQRRLRPVSTRMIDHAFRRIKAQADRLNATAVYAMIPMPGDRFAEEDQSSLFDAAKAAGFTVIDMADVFVGHEQLSVTLKATDFHPNARGHAIIADRLLRELQRHALIPPHPSAADGGAEAPTGTAAAGGGLYQEYCARCHESGDGRAPGRSVMARLSPERVLSALESGSMATLALARSSGERRAIAAFVAGRPFGTDAAAPLAEPGCPADSTLQDSFGGTVLWSGWGAGETNARFQSAAVAGLTPGQIPGLTAAWAFGFPGDFGAASHPTVAGGRVFVGSADGTVYALDAKSGCVHWAFRAEAMVRNAISVGWSQPAGGGVLAALFGDIHANVYAVDAQSGRLLWKVRVEEHPEARITGSPLLHEGRLYVPVSSLEEVTAADPDYECCRFRGSVVALDADTGRQAWKTFTIAEAPRLQGKTAHGTPHWGPSGAAVWSAPTFDTRTNRIYVATGDNYSQPTSTTSDAVLALAADTGRLLWTRQLTEGDTWNMACGSPNKANCPEPEGPDLDFGASPILATLPGGRRVLIAGQKSGVLHALDPDQQGAILWQQNVTDLPRRSIMWGPAIDGTVVYAASSGIARIPARPGDPQGGTRLDPSAGGGLSAFEIRTGKRLWTTAPRPCGVRPGCSPAQSAAVTVIPGVVFSGSLDGYLRAYATATGAMLWEVDTARPFDTVNQVTARGGALDGPGVAVAGGFVYVVSGYGWSGAMPGNVLLAFSSAGR